jgi:hypothetical protein
MRRRPATWNVATAMQTIASKMSRPAHKIASTPNRPRQRPLAKRKTPGNTEEQPNASR